MELKQILQLIDAVSGSSLDKFEYEENGSKLSLEKGKEPVIESEYEGEIAEIYVENGQSVEYGQPLFRII